MKKSIKFFSAKRTTIGILLIILAIALMFVWEFFGRERLLYDKALVLTSDVPKGTVISQDMIGTKYVDLKGREVLKEEDAETLIGKETAQFVKGNEVLYDKYFDQAGLMANQAKDQFVMSIPSDWIYSYPQTLRRGDQVVFYNRGNEITSAKVAYVKNGSNQEVKSVDGERLDGSSTVTQLEVIVTKEQATKLANTVANKGRMIILYN